MLEMANNMTSFATTLQPTEEQASAIHTHDKNLIVVAGAGSGKTRVLVQRYLQLLADNPDWRLKSLVAITFTREAAFEMRHRIRLELEARAAHDSSGPWPRHLSEMDSARIDTIHGLCVSILRANAAIAGIDPKFDVLDEVEAAIHLETVIDGVLQTLDPKLLALFTHYDSYLISETLARFDLINAEYPKTAPQIDELMEQWHTQWSHAVFEARDLLVDSREVVNVRDSSVSVPNDALGKLFWQYANYLSEIASELDPNRIWQLVRICQRDGEVGNKGSAALWGGKEAKADAAQQLRDLRNRLEAVIKRIGDGPGEVDRQSAALLPLWIRLLSQVQRAYRYHKLAQGLLDFDDLERLTARVVRNQSVSARYRNAEYKHLLVDEFQDTNRAQWKIIRALADLGRGGSLFAVGDPKQSIYQFRGADVSVFNRVRDQIAENSVGLDLPLSTSFRSHSRLIAQFNALFQRILVRDESSPVADFEVVFGKDMSAFRQESPAGAAIQCLLLDSQMPDDGNSGSNTRRRQKRYPADAMRHWEAIEIAHTIKTMIDDGRQVYDRDCGGFRGVEFADFAILFQSMNKVGIYEEIFKSLQIPFLTISGRGYFNRQEVWDMLDLLRCLHNPLDNLSLASVLRSPMFAFSDDLLFALRLIIDEDSESGAPIPLWQALRYACENQVAGVDRDDQHLLLFAADTLSELRGTAGRVSISELLRQALSLTGYLAILTGLPDGARRRGNIEKLLQLADESGKTTLGRFSRYLQDLSAREIREGEALQEAGNAVRLMTVHASKGLEFPCVILADASWERRSGSTPTVLHDADIGFSCQVFDEEANKYVSGIAHRHNAKMQALKEAAERKRLLYVAATRAQDYLLISGQLRRDAKGKWKAGGWLQLLVSAFELEEMEKRAEQTIEFAGDAIRLWMPPGPPPQELRYASVDDGRDLWDRPANGVASEPMSFPMIDPIAPNAASPLRHISVTQIADIGAFRYSQGREREHYRKRWLRSTRHDLPGQITDLHSYSNAGVSARIIGTIVHELLRYELTEADDLMIRSLAWQEGLIDEQQIEEAVNKARGMLAAFRRSEVFRWIDDARSAGRPLFTELPFVCSRKQRIIHGVVDVLLRQADGEWIIIDYKTARSSADTRRHHLQLGVYAAAAQARLGLPHPPQTFLHFIPDNRTVRVEREQCLAELDQLEAIIHSVEAHVE